MRRNANESSCRLNRRRSPLSGRLRSVDGRTEERLARNEALFREVNEAINGLAERLDSGMEQGFVCECSDTSCAPATPPGAIAS